jgi:hypothetical protein
MIKNGSKGFKLIAAETLAPNANGKPIVNDVEFFDYKDRELRGFKGLEVVTYFCEDFKHALKAIQSDNFDSLIQII